MLDGVGWFLFSIKSIIQHFRRDQRNCLNEFCIFLSWVHLSQIHPTFHHFLRAECKYTYRLSAYRILEHFSF